MTKKADNEQGSVSPADGVALGKGKARTAPVGEKAAAKSTRDDFPIVGIGASAGGLAAFEAFFAGMPSNTDPGMAFALVQHLAPDHKSILTELVQRYTRMRVFEVEDGMAVQPNCAYIIPPNRDMAFLRGTLQLLEPSAPRGQRMAIDFFFRSLADDQHERAIGVVLSGTGSDGTLGVRAIKGEGGMVMVQSPATTEYDGMPRSALATGLVDYELPPAEMVAQILAYASFAFGRPRQAARAPQRETDSALKKIFILLRKQTGHDFSQYKLSTVHRRIDRRMALHQIDSVEGYVKYLQQTPAEIETLFGDMLIGVTNFFRDPEAFESVEEQIIRELFSEAAAKRVIRVWSVGCSTGEEAYSLAMVLAEHQEKARQHRKVQVFATDIDGRAIATARAGVYPASIAADIAPGRLERHFSAESDGSLYRVHKNIRDMLVFSEQNVVKDPPFSRMDLISCRNLLIYVDTDLQRKIISVFHYALNPGGFLFLGTSENLGELGDLFATIDRKWKLYRRSDDPHHQRPPRLAPAVKDADESLAPVVRKAAAKQAPSMREVTEAALLRHMAPVAALVNRNGDILYIHGRSGLYLEPASGESGVNNILKMAREGLQRDLGTALRGVVAGREIVRCPNLRVRTNGAFTTVDLTVSSIASKQPQDATAPAPEAGVEAPLFLVMLEPARSPPANVGTSVRGASGDSAAARTHDDAQTMIESLRNELQAKEEYLQTTSEELETANEELRSSSEEMQSVNEELQSTNEELETSKEELQSVNEELFTVNAELQVKVSDLTRANNDMNNLLAGTDIATVFVDHELRILRFTPAATRIINLIQSDIGRPVAHIVSNLSSYDTLPQDTQSVLDTLAPKVAEVQTKEGGWYNMSILPYRTLDNVIEGAVITFLDITSAKRAQERLEQANSRVTEAVVATVREPLVVLDSHLRITMVNGAFCSTFGVAADAAIGTLLYDVSNRQWDIPALRELLEKNLPQAQALNDCALSHEFVDIGARTMLLNARFIREAGQSELILLSIEDITGRETTGGRHE